MSSDSTTVHTPVLLQEILSGLDIQAEDVVVDGTTGGGGHSKAFLEKHPKRLVCLDADADALERAKGKLAEAGSTEINFVHSNFRKIASVLDSLGITTVDKILFDLGLSSDQLEQSGRGFSFQHPEEPLNMAFAGNAELTAEIILNVWGEDTLATILEGYGEERYSKKIAAAIVGARKTAPIKTVADLVSVVSGAVPASYRRQRINPATRTFQALRIAVNDELRALEEGVRSGWEHLAPSGRIAIISFHSLEDRIVKRFFRDKAKAGDATLLTKKPIIATKEEMAANPRSRSAKLRILVKE